MSKAMSTGVSRWPGRLTPGHAVIMRAMVESGQRKTVFSGMAEACERADTILWWKVVNGKLCLAAVLRTAAKQRH